MICLFRRIIINNWSIRSAQRSALNSQVFVFSFQNVFIFPLFCYLCDDFIFHVPQTFLVTQFIIVASGFWCHNGCLPSSLTHSANRKRKARSFFFRIQRRPWTQSLSSYSFKMNIKMIEMSNDRVRIFCCGYEIVMMALFQLSK